ncbi:MAG TPA: PfkB family carbohydrate kinase [Pirellulales bacterium]|nr:PfkB family carbohydrate kinase [Pirellulales bacterium]
MKTAPLVSLARLESLLAALPKLTIGLVGDLFLDRYLEIDPEMSELSIETGLEAYQVTRIRNSPGALGTVMNNLAALGVGRLVPVTVLGDDGQAYDLLQELDRMPVDASHVIRDPGRLTPTYTKPMRRGEGGVWHELNRIDLRNKAALAEKTQARLCEMLADVFAATDGLIVLDQVNEEGWGVITPAVRQHLAALAEKHPERLMFVDSRAQIAKFRRGTLKPNVHECLAALGRKATGAADEPEAAARDFARLTGCPLYCTVGERGILVADPREAPVLAPGYPVAGPVDIVGAGDSATAGIVSALLAGASRLEAAAVGNLVASITVQQLGTTGTASPVQVRDRWNVVHT